MVWFDYYVCAYTNMGEKMKVEAVVILDYGLLQKCPMEHNMSYDFKMKMHCPSYRISNILNVIRFFFNHGSIQRLTLLEFVHVTTVLYFITIFDSLYPSYVLHSKIYQA